MSSKATTIFDDFERYVISSLFSAMYEIAPVSFDDWLRIHSDRLTEPDGPVRLKSALLSLLQKGLIRILDSSLRSEICEAINLEDVAMPRWLKRFSAAYPPDGSLVLCENSEGVLAPELTSFAIHSEGEFGWTEIDPAAPPSGERFLHCFGSKEFLACRLGYDRFADMCGLHSHPVVCRSVGPRGQVNIKDQWWREVRNGWHVIFAYKRVKTSS